MSKIGVSLHQSELGLIVIADLDTHRLEGERYGAPGYRYLPDPG